MGATDIGFHRASDTTKNLSSTAIETQPVNVSAVDTAFSVTFTSAASFSAGDIVGISVNPTNNHGNANLTCIYEFDFVS